VYRVLVWKPLARQTSRQEEYFKMDLIEIDSEDVTWMCEISSSHGGE
jgi:hypothetical protein